MGFSCGSDSLYLIPKEIKLQKRILKKVIGKNDLFFAASFDVLKPSKFALATNAGVAGWTWVETPHLKPDHFLSSLFS